MILKIDMLFLLRGNLQKQAWALFDDAEKL